MRANNAEIIHNGDLILQSSEIDSEEDLQNDDLNTENTITEILEEDDEEEISPLIAKIRESEKSLHSEISNEFDERKDTEENITSESHTGSDIEEDAILSQDSEQGDTPEKSEEIREISEDNLEEPTLVNDSEIEIQDTSKNSEDKKILEESETNEIILENNKEIAKIDEENSQVTIPSEKNLIEENIHDEENNDSEKIVNLEKSTIPNETESEKAEDILNEEALDESIHKDPNNLEKTFDELEKESDNFFSNEEIDFPKKDENKEEIIPNEPKKLSDEAANLLQKSNQTVTEILKKDPPKKHDPHIEKLYELTKSAKTLIARGLNKEAKSVIIEGISLRKDHRDLNLLLGEIYEAENRFDKAEIIYKDLALAHTDDEEILKHLANNLIITKKTDIAYEIYKKILSLGNDEENALYILANLAREKNDMSDTYHYSRLYLKKWPMDKDMLALLSESQIILGKRKEAIETLTKLKNLSPYDAHEISAYIEKLRAEEMASKNFVTENSLTEE